MLHVCYDSGNGLRMVYNVVVKLLWCKIIKKPMFFILNRFSHPLQVENWPEFTKTHSTEIITHITANVTGLVNTVTALSIGLYSNCVYTVLS